MYSDPDGLMFVHLGFKVTAANRFVFQDMISGPNNILQLYDKRVEKLVNVTRNPGGGVDDAPVDKLAEWNFKLLVYYDKICELRSSLMVLADINDNSLRRIEDNQNLATFHVNSDNSPLVITQS